MKLYIQCYKNVSSIQLFIEFIDSDYRRDFLAQFLDHFIGHVDNDFYFPVSRFDGRRLLEILKKSEKKGDTYSIVKIRNIVLSCIDIGQNFKNPRIVLDDSGCIHEVEMCGDAENKHLGCLEFNKKCIYIDLNGEIIGHIKANGEKSFISYIDMNDKDGNTALVQGGLYSLHGAYEIFLPKYNFDTLDDNSIYTAEFESLKLQFGRFSGLMNTDVYFFQILKSMQMKKRVSVNKMVIDFLEGLMQSRDYEAEEILYFGKNVKNSGFLIPTENFSPSP